MNKDIFTGKWIETKGKLQQLWGQLTEDDCKVIEGNHQEIFGTLQKYYGYTREQVEKAIDGLKNKH